MNEPETSDPGGALRLRLRAPDDAAIEVVAVGGAEVAPDFDALLEARPRVPVEGPCSWALQPATQGGPGAELVLDATRPRTARVRVAGYPPAPADPRPRVVTCEIGGVTGGLQLMVRGRAPRWPVHPDGAAVVLDDPSFLAYARDQLSIQRGPTGARENLRRACVRLHDWVQDLESIGDESYGMYLASVWSELASAADLDGAKALLTGAEAELALLDQDLADDLPPEPAPEVVSGRIAAIAASAARTEAALNVAADALSDYVATVSGGAERVLVVLEVTKATSFTIFGAAGGAVLGGSALAGLAANTAADLLGRSVEHAVRIELGLEPDSWDRFWRESIKNLAINAAGASAGAVVSALSKGLAARIVDKVGLVAFRSASASLTREAAVDFVKDGLGGAAGGFVQTAVQAVWAACGGQRPSWGEFLAALVTNVAQNGLGAALKARSDLQGGPFDVFVFDSMLAGP
jgi:hypothetical protein